MGACSQLFQMAVTKQHSHSYSTCILSLTFFQRNEKKQNSSICFFQINLNPYKYLYSIWGKYKEQGSKHGLWCLIFFFLIKYFWLCWVFVAVRGLSLVASGGFSSLWCAGFSLWWLLLLWSSGSRCAGSVVVALGLTRSVACGIFPDGGSNQCPLHQQADS